MILNLMPWQWKWLVIVSVVVFCFAYFFPATTQAHSTLEKTFPAAGATVDKSPAKVELWFEDPVVVHSESIQVVDEKGNELQRGKPFIDTKDPRHIILFVQEKLPAGAYTVQYNLIALDGFVIRDQFKFLVTESEATIQTEDKFRLVKSNPIDGEIAAAAPAQMDLWFSHPAKVSAFGIFGRDTNVVTKEPYADSADPRHIIIPLETSPSPGTYQVTWYAVPLNPDGTTNQREFVGIFYFSIGEVTSLVSNQNSTTLPPPFKNPLGVKHVAHALAFLGLLTLVGGTWFQAVIAGKLGNYRPWKKVFWLLYGSSVLGLLLLIIVRRLELGEMPLSEFMSLQFVWIPIVQIILLSISTFLLHNKLQLVGLVAAVLLWPFSTGHSTYPRYGGYFAVGMDMVHLLAISVWMGGLLAFLLMIPKDNSISWLQQGGSKYAKWAFWAMILLILTGIGMTLQYVPSFTVSSLMVSDWGKAILIKVLMVLLIVTLAYWQRRGLQRMSEKAMKALVRRGVIELLYAMLIIFAATVLIESSPSAASQGIFPNSSVQQGLKVNVEISPLSLATNDIFLRFDDKPALKQVKVKLFMLPDWTKENTAFDLGNGIYKLTGNYLHAAGTMDMEVEAWKADGSKVVFPFRVVVPGEMRMYE